MTKKNFLVTGGNGYIGSHMCKYLHENGHGVVILDNYITSPPTNTHEYGTFVRGDIADSKLVSRLLSENIFDCVFHFAARAIVAESEANPFMYFNDNTVKSNVFFEVLLKNGIKNIVFSSTCSTYGNNLSEDLLSESTTQSPVNAYAVSKKLLEEILIYASQRFNVNVGILRYFNVAGSDPEFLIGENHIPETHLIPNLCLSYLKGQEIKFQLFGDNHPTTDGTCVRDYIHVCDLARAHYQTFEYINKHGGANIYNLGSGQGYSVKEVISVFEQLTGTKVKYEVVPARKGDPPRLASRVDKAVRELGFSNQHDLQDCIKHTLGYLKKKISAS